MYRSILAVLFNKTDLAVSLIANQIMKVETSITNTLYQSLSYFYGAVAMIDTPILTTEQQTWLKKAMESIRQYSVYAKSAYLHKYVFLLAELNKSNGNICLPRWIDLKRRLAWRTVQGWRMTRRS